jgi:cytochrome c oxidase subunit 3
MGIEAINPFELPLLNTVILLSSGATVTYAHHSLINERRKGALIGSLATIVLAAVFTLFQVIEYNVSSFTLSDGIFGSCFFFGTGFHGLILHIALLIYICYNNNNNNNKNGINNYYINNINPNKDYNKEFKGLNIEFLE